MICLMAILMFFEQKLLADAGIPPKLGNMKSWLPLTQILSLAVVAFSLHAADPVVDKKPEPLAVAKWPGLENFPGKGGIANADWFHAAWAFRRTHFWEQRNNDKHAIVFLGDSITQGWASLEKDFPN